MQRIIVLGEEYTFQVVNANVHFGTLQLFPLVTISPTGAVTIISCMVYALSSRDNAWMWGHCAAFRFMFIKKKNISEGGNKESTIIFQQATLWVWNMEDRGEGRY